MELLADSEGNGYRIVKNRMVIENWSFDSSLDQQQWVSSEVGKAKTEFI
jgi:hypothetical protein